jgi:gluconolactonase
MNGVTAVIFMGRPPARIILPVSPEADPMTDALSAILEPTPPERLATGFGFTEGPLWHPDGFYDVVDIPHPWYRIRSR